MSKIKILLLVLVFGGSVSGCATKVTSIKKDADVNIKVGEGYLLMAVDTNLNLQKIKISGRKSIELTNKDLRIGSNYILINLPAGNYSFERVVFRSARGRTWSNLTEGMWDFKVSQGAISYVGHVKVKTSYWSYWTSTELVNNISQAMVYMEQNFANILKSRVFEYHGPGEDNFLEVTNDGQSNHRKEQGAVQ